MQRGEVWKGEIINLRKDGSSYWEALTVSPNKNEDGLITHRVYMKEDISLRKELEQDIARIKMGPPSDFGNFFNAVIDQAAFDNVRKFIDYANAASDAASLDHQRAGQTVALKAIEAYEGLALAQAYERVMKAAVASAEGHVGQAQSMVDNEMATEADLLQAKVYLSGLQQRFIEVQNMVAVAGQYIKLLTAVDTDLPLAVARDLEVEPVTPPPAQFDPAGSRSRADIAARRKQADAAGKMVGVARGAMLPHVNLGVQKDYYSQDKIFGNDADSWTLGVYATWDVFKGLQNISALKKARAQERAARYMADFETRQAGVQATEAWLNLAAAHDKVAVAREAVTSAREGLRIVTNQYREGLVSMVDLLDTQAAANMAEGNLVQALHDYQVGLARLEYMAAVPVGADVLDRRDSNANPEQDR